MMAPITALRASVLLIVPAFGAGFTTLPIDEPVDGFDTSFFGMDAPEAATLLAALDAMISSYQKIFSNMINQRAQAVTCVKEINDAHDSPP